MAQRWPMGSLVKVEAVYPTPFWRSAGLSGQALTAPGLLTGTFDNSPPDGNPGVLIAFVSGQQARLWTLRKPAERRSAVLASFAAAFGPDALKPTEYFEFDWSSEVDSRGGPVAYTGPGVLLDFGATFRTSLGPVHWAGTETSTFWTGYMEGAVRAGERAAREILRQ